MTSACVTSAMVPPSCRTEQVVDRADDPRLQVTDAFSAGNSRRAAVDVEVPPFRKPREFFERQPGPFAEIDLVEVLALLERKAPGARERPRGVDGPEHRARVDRVKRPVTKPVRQPRRLRVADAVQLNAGQAPGEPMSCCVGGGVPDEQGHQCDG